MPYASPFTQPTVRDPIGSEGRMFEAENAALRTQLRRPSARTRESDAAASYFDEHEDAASSVSRKEQSNGYRHATDGARDSDDDDLARGVGGLGIDDHEDAHTPTGPQKETQNVDADKWCALCEQDGHLAFDCPNEQY